MNEESTVKKIKWKNIGMLVLAVVAIFVVVTLVDILNVVIHGNCVEKEFLKGCVSLKKSEIECNTHNEVTVRVTNTGKMQRSTAINLLLSPNLESDFNTTQVINAFSPGDTVEKTFDFKSKSEKGNFWVGIDINGDASPDKSLYVTVK